MEEVWECFESERVARTCCTLQRPVQGLCRTAFASRSSHRVEGRIDDSLQSYKMRRRILWRSPEHNGSVTYRVTSYGSINNSDINANNKLSERVIFSRVGGVRGVTKDRKSAVELADRDTLRSLPGQPHLP
ncbi:hypothetical protein J6590_032811 [Homalodisca vitripennis]|nr:hypothetical protein J6590_032811 [Homalodisca vitripennis]